MIKKTSYINTVCNILPDGQQIWEMEATVDKDKSQPVSMQNIGCPLVELLRQQLVFKG